MSDGKSHPVKKEQFVKLSREVLESEAWRSLRINERRLVDFLMLEHMKCAAKHNGKLKAPYDQLEEWGIGARHIAKAIRGAEMRGIITCRRGGMKVATDFSLTWLPPHDGAAPTSEWRNYTKASPKKPRRKIRKQPHDGKVEQPSQGKADGPNLPSQGKADTPETPPSQGMVHSRYSYQGGDVNSDLSVPDGGGISAAVMADAPGYMRLIRDDALWQVPYLPWQETALTAITHQSDMTVYAGIVAPAHLRGETGICGGRSGARRLDPNTPRTREQFP
jgi:hypothetical protein